MVSDRVRRLFQVCSQAQYLAWTLAAAAAQDRPLQPSAAMLTALYQESLREHLWRLLLDWPPLLNLPAATQAMATILNASRTTPQQAQTALITASEDIILGMDARRWLTQCCDPDALHDWSQRGTTLVAHLVQALYRNNITTLGATPPLRTVEALDLGFLETALGGADAAAFVAAPTWQGACCETTLYTRYQNQPLLIELSKQYENGILTRLAAILIAIATATDALTAPTPPAAGQILCPAPGIALAAVAAARGILVHRVVMERGLVRDYHILAPTEWNFHPQGVAARGLATLAPSAHQQPWARLYLTALDPCVDFQLA